MSAPRSTIAANDKICGGTGHNARDCEGRKLGEQVLYVDTEEDLDDDERADETAFITINEVVLFSKSHVLLYNQASVKVFCNTNLLANIRYDHAAGRFTLKPARSRNIYSFCRQPVPGSNG